MGWVPSLGLFFNPSPQNTEVEKNTFPSDVFCICVFFCKLLKKTNKWVFSLLNQNFAVSLAVRREDRLHSEKIKINFVFSLICCIFVSAKKTLIYHEHYRTISQLREV